VVAEGSGVEGWRHTQDGSRERRVGRRRKRRREEGDGEYRGGARQ